MRKEAILLAVLFLVSTLPYIAPARLVNAQFFDQIRITSTGTVTPTTAPIECTGDVFKITSNIYNSSLIVERNNIIINGQGFSLQGPGNRTNGLAAIKLECTNVTVANFHISGWQIGVLGVFDNNTIVANNFTNNAWDVAVYANNYRIIGNYLGPERIVGNNNIISQNHITLEDFVSGFWISSSIGTIIQENDVTLSKLTTFFVSTDNGDFQIFHNNFLNIEEHTGGYLLLIFNYPQNHINATSPPWDNGFPSGGNYWSDYARRYPAAVELNATGVGSLQYVSATTPKVIDRYPLITPYEFTRPALPTVPDKPSPPGPETDREETQPPMQVTAIFALALLAIIVAAFGVLVYWKKRKSPQRGRGQESLTNVGQGSLTKTL